MLRTQRPSIGYLDPLLHTLHVRKLSLDMPSSAQRMPMQHDVITTEDAGESECDAVAGAHRLQLLQVLQLSLELVQVGVCIAAQHRAIKGIPEHLQRG